MKADVILPRSSQHTTPLGVGMATLMREPSPAAQQRLLHAAHEAGFRHFDVAPSYGLGTAERVLGRFLRSRPAGITVATKVGILARGNAGLMRLVQQPARALLRRFPSLRGRATQAVGAAVHVPGDFSIDKCQRSLENSLRALGVDAIDLYLLHDPRPADVTPELVEWLVRLRERGTVRNVGLAASPEYAAEVVKSYPGSFDATQVPSHLLSPKSAGSADGQPRLRVTHSVLAIPFARASARLQVDPAWGGELSERLGADVAAPGVLARMMLAFALIENRGGIVLLGASKEEHLRAAPRAVGAFEEPRLLAAAAYLQQSLGTP